MAQTNGRPVRPRRATLAQATQSPGLSLFPGTMSSSSRIRATETLCRGPLQRSNTSPAALSPRSLPGDSQPGLPIPKLQEEAGTAALRSAHPVTDARPTDTSRITEEDSNLVASPASIVSVHDSTPLRPKIREPDWDMVKPSTSTSTTVSSSSISTSTAPSTTSSSAVISKLRPAPLEEDSRIQPSAQLAGSRDHIRDAVQRPHNASSPESTLDANSSAVQDALAEAQRITAADLSIARQISISREQRRMLLAKTTEIGKRGINVLDTTMGENLVDRRTRTPTLVGNGHVHRKSEMAVFEEEEEPDESG